jgi:(2Fe-2S) ferredoxin
VLLIRRPGRGPRQAEHAWAVVDHTSSHQHWGRWREAADLHAAADALVADVRPQGPQVDLLLVCAHGLHDTCCAVRGRPVAAALAAQWPETTWECSHVGGDRFAANLLVLPDGTCYGNLSPARACAVVEAHLAGAVTPEQLRGVSTEEPVVQAAIIEGHAQLGPGGARELVGADVRSLSPESWRVRLAGRGSMPAMVEATVTRRRQPPARLTCRALGDSAAYVYDVTDLVVVDAAGRACG